MYIGLLQRPTTFSVSVVRVSITSSDVPERNLMVSPTLYPASWSARHSPAFWGICPSLNFTWFNSSCKDITCRTFCFLSTICMKSALYAPSACSTPSIFEIASTSSCVTPYVLSALISIRLLSSKYASPVSLISGSDARIPEKNATPSATINKIDRNRPGLFRISI